MRPQGPVRKSTGGASRTQCSGTLLAALPSPSRRNVGLSGRIRTIGLIGMTGKVDR